MNQDELEKRAREIFEQQGFGVRETAAGFEAVKGDEVKQIQVFSSAKYSMEEVKSQLESESIVFVDEEMSKLSEMIENQVSVLSKDKEDDVETPSYEMIGDIAVVNELPDMSEAEAVEAIRHYETGVKTVLLKEEGLSGEFRVGDYKKLYGEETETVHKEFGCRFKVDPTKVYYSERFSTERNRVVSQIEEGEKVLVMFAGVGPYAIMAARNANPEKVVAVEKNPEACEYLKENIELNSVGEKVEAYCGDVKDILPELGKFDRIVMPLPDSAEKFLPLVLQRVHGGSMIHLYKFLDEASLKNYIISTDLEGISLEKVESIVTGSKGPGIHRYCFDVKISDC